MNTPFLWICYYYNYNKQLLSSKITTRSSFISLPQVVIIVKRVITWFRILNCFGNYTE